MSEVTYARGNGSFGPEDIAQLVAGLELALQIWTSKIATTRR
jgi:hypothetical protein